MEEDEMYYDEYQDCEINDWDITEQSIVDEIEDDVEEDSDISTNSEYLHSIAKKVEYLNDLELTTQLIKEANEYKAYAEYKEMVNKPSEFNGVKREAPSDDLCLKFIRIYDGIIHKPNFSGYSPDYKEEFFSKAQYLFIRHWFKFDPLKVRKNYRVSPKSNMKSVGDIQVERSKNGVKLKEKIEQGELILKPHDEFEGGFSWFTLLCMTACTDSISMFKKRRAQHQELVQSVVDKNSENKQYDKFDYSWIDV